MTEIEQVQYELGNPLLKEILPAFVLREVRYLAEYFDQDQRKVDEIPILFGAFEGCAQINCDPLKRFMVYNGRHHRIFQMHLGGVAYWLRCDNSYVTLLPIHGSLLHQFHEERIHECWVIRFPEWDGQFWEVYRVTMKPQEEIAEDCPVL